MLMRGTQSPEVAVIGAGPYGLATSAHLRGRGMSVRTFGYPMGAWRDNMPKGMFLKSAFEATSISAPNAGLALVDYCNEKGVTEIDDWHPIPIDVFVNYGLWFQERAVKDVEQVMVRDVAPLDGGFRVSLANGETFLAKNVVAATGHVHFSYTPRELRGVIGRKRGSPVVTHTGEHADFDAFANKAVAVIGAGQSALESAVLLHEAGAEVHLIVRGKGLEWANPPSQGDGILPRVLKPKTPFGPGWSHFFFTRAPELISYLPAATRLMLAHSTYGPSGGWWLKKRFDSGIKVSLGTVVEKVHQAKGRVFLSLREHAGRTSTLAVDHVLVATGYKVDVDAMDYLDPEMRSRVVRVKGSGAPALSLSCESSVPGLYFVGLSGAASFGPLVRFVHGTHFAATAVSKALAATSGRSAQPAPSLVS